MKKILALLILIFSLASCGKDSKTEEPVGELGTEDFGIKELLDKMGIKPSDWQNINNIYGVDDSINYKLAWGQQDTCAWIAKFQPDGTEIWNYKFPIKKTIIYNIVRPTIINDILILLFLTQPDDPYDTNAEYCIYPTTINFTSGNIISQTELKKEFLSSSIVVESLSNYYKFTIGNNPSNYYLYLIDYDGNFFWQCISEYPYPYFYPCFDNIFIYRPYDVNRYTLINKKGEIIWQRGFVSGTEEDFSYYGDGKTTIFLDNERFFYKVKTDNSSFKIINLKEYTLLYTLTEEQLPLKGDNFEKENISYQWDTCYIKNNNIHLIYNENQTVISSPDPISGTSTYETQTIGKYYYDIDKETYQVVGNGKLE